MDKRYRLASGEEVISHVFGEASTFRPLLLAIREADERKKQSDGDTLGDNEIR